MTSCREPIAHHYDPSLGVFGNLFGRLPDGFGLCPEGFLLSTDVSSLVLLVGVVTGTTLWNKAPRFAGAALSGTTIFWAFYQFASYRFQSTIYELDGELATRLKTAAIHQFLFEAVFFLLLPAGIAFWWRRRSEKKALR